MGATFMDEDGKEKPLIMGCYGVGVSRSLAAVVEQHNDEHGIVWPVSVAPYEVAVIPLDPKKEECATVCDQIVEGLCARVSRLSWMTATSAPALSLPTTTLWASRIR